MAKITNSEFNAAIAHLRDGDVERCDPIVTGQVMITATLVIKHRRGIPYEVLFHPTPAEVTEFLAGLSQPQLRQLKRFAECVDFEGIEQ